jgi:hypothetical protein
MAWQIVRYTNDKLNPSLSNRFYVGLGDIIKFGRVRFRIKKMQMDGSEDDGYVTTQNHVREVKPIDL